MHVLLWKLNHKNVQLDHYTRGEVIGVLRQNREYQYLPWCGFLDLELASDLRNAKPVKLQVDRIGLSGGISITWEEIETTQHVQGCLTPKGVYAILVGDVIRLV